MSSESEQTLEQHLDDLPMLTEEYFNCLDKVAIDARNSDSEVVLGVSDLLRRRPDGSHTLHPRVMQLLSPSAVDTTLTRITKCINKRIDYAAYQYPTYLVEHREEGSQGLPLCPSDYSIDVLDALRDLRANDVLVSLRRRGESPPDKSTLEGRIDGMKNDGEIVEGVVVVACGDEEKTSARPSVIIEDREPLVGRRSCDELADLCETVKQRFNALISIRVASECDFYTGN